MTDSMIHLQMILVDQIFIYLQSPLMIEPARIKEPDIPQIRLQLPYMLRHKIMLLILPPLMIHHISFRLVILILSMVWRNMCLSNVGSTEDTDVENMVK